MTHYDKNSGNGRFRAAVLASACASVLVLAACGEKKPEGQVVAVIDGEEITAQEVNGELGAAGNAQGTDQQMRNAALEQVVNRRLLADVAANEGIETSPEYILRKRKQEESLLIQMLGEKLSRNVKQPSSQQLEQMMRENPQAFADRTLFAVDQIIFPKPERNDVVTALGPVKSMDEVVTVLNRFGVKFQRGSNTIDSASLPPAVFAQFKQVGTSEPLIIPTPTTIAITKIVDTRQLQPQADVARNVAGNAYVKREVEKGMKQRLDALRAKAKIDYQSGFKAPPAPATAAGGAQSATAPAAAN